MVFAYYTPITAKMEEGRGTFSVSADKCPLREGYFCISAQKRVYFFGEMVYNRVTGYEHPERTNEFEPPTQGVPT